jgi:glutathione S-transferase
MKEIAMTSLTLISHHLCPYVQRAAIALHEKGVPFERINVDLANKPDWFKAISPLGKVPLLKVGDEVIFESAVIVEYLEETQPNPLHPADPLTRARHRAWIEFGSTILADLWGLLYRHRRREFPGQDRHFARKFERLEAELGDGPYFAGEKFSVVDAVFAPVFRYFDVSIA